MTGEERNDWLNTAEKFIARGNIKAAKAAVKEVLAFSASDALAVLAELSLYSGETEKAREYLSCLAVGNGGRAEKKEKTSGAGKREEGKEEPVNYKKAVTRGEYVKALLEMEKNNYPAAITILENLLKKPTIVEAANEFDCATKEKANRYLADAYYLLGEPLQAAKSLFAASKAAEKKGEKTFAAALYSKALFLMAYRPGSPQKLREMADHYGEYFKDIKPLAIARPLGKNSRRTLKIGCLSRDFRHHAMGNFLSPLLRHFDRKNFIVYAYMTGPADDLTLKFRRLGAAWADVSEESPEMIARRIAGDRIDILFDFTGHSQENSLPVLAYRPAPVIISGLGYLHTSGLEAVDYHLTDRVAYPSDSQAQIAFREKLLYVDQDKAPEEKNLSLFCFSPLDREKYPPVAPLPSKNGRHFTFGCLNNYAKLSDQTLLVWRAILEKLPDARLILQNKLASIPEGIRIIKDRFRNFGIDVDRVECRPYSPNYLKTYEHIDVALDTFPYTGGATTCEALYMGVPVITLAGALPASRIGASILTAVGMEEFITTKDVEYIKCAVQIASEPEKLAAYRKELRKKLENSPLMDAAGYTRALERTCRYLFEKTVISQKIDEA